MTNHREVLKQAASLLNERGAEYGPEDACFQRSAELATVALNKSISKYDVAMILAMNKVARLQESRTKMDHYVDNINYMAFAAQFAAEQQSVEVAVEDDIKKMAERLAPEIRVIPTRSIDAYNEIKVTGLAASEKAST